jgi:hypothetical protein
MSASLTGLLAAIAIQSPAAGTARPDPPIRPPGGPDAPDFIAIAKAGANAPADRDGNFVISPDYIEAEVLPAVEQHLGIKLTRDPEGRAAMGCSPGAAAAFTMAWFHPEWYHRVISYSGHLREPALTLQRRHTGWRGYPR